MARIPFLGPTYSGRSTNVNDQRCVNWYVDIDTGRGGRADVYLLPTPGTVQVGNLGGSPVRGMHVVRSSITSGERLFIVAGSILWELDTDFNATSRGTLLTATGKVSISDNGQDSGDQLFITDGIYKNATANGYVFNLATNTLTTVTDVDFPNPTQNTFINQLFVVAEQNSGRFYVSDVLNGLSWDGTAFATAESSPDNLVSLISSHSELWLFGETTTEVWEHTGAADFPFSRVPGAVFEWGCAAQYSVAKSGNTIVWLSQNDQGNAKIIMANGFQTQVISTPAIEYQLSQYSVYQDAHAFTYQMEGHTFYVLTFPTESRTWVYDLSTQMWHERSFGGLENRWHAQTYAFFNQQHLIGDYRDGRVYNLDLNAYTDAGGTIQRMRRSQAIEGDRDRLFHHRLEIVFESGTGLPEGQGSDPQAMLRYSDDGGHTWSTQLFRSMGKQGEFEKRAVWRRLGSARNRIYELQVSDPVKSVVVSAFLRVSEGAQ